MPYIIGVQELPQHMVSIPGVVLVHPHIDKVTLHADDLRHFSTIKLPQNRNICSDLEKYCEPFRCLNAEMDAFTISTYCEMVVRTIRTHIQLIADTCGILETLDEGNNRDGLVEAIGESGLPFVERLRSTQLYQSFRDRCASVQRVNLRQDYVSRSSSVMEDVYTLFHVLLSGTLNRRDIRKELKRLDRVRTNRMARKRLRPVASSERQHAQKPCRVAESHYPG